MQFRILLSRPISRFSFWRQNNAKMSHFKGKIGPFEGSEVKVKVEFKVKITGQGQERERGMGGGEGEREREGGREGVVFSQ